MEVNLIEILGNLVISHCIVVIGIKSTLLCVALTYCLIGEMISQFHNIIILAIAIITYGLIDQAIWTLTTYLLSFLYPV